MTKRCCRSLLARLSTVGEIVDERRSLVLEFTDATLDDIADADNAHQSPFGPVEVSTAILILRP